MESAGREFFARVHNGYLSMAAEEPKRFVVVDGMRSVDDIAQEIADVVDNRQHLLKKEGQEES
jgi:thymidylate kinase